MLWVINCGGAWSRPNCCTDPGQVIWPPPGCLGKERRRPSTLFRFKHDRCRGFAELKSALPGPAWPYIDIFARGCYALSGSTGGAGKRSGRDKGIGMVGPRPWFSEGRHNSKQPLVEPFPFFRKTEHHTTIRHRVFIAQTWSIASWTIFVFFGNWFLIFKIFLGI